MGERFSLPSIDGIALDCVWQPTRLPSRGCLVAAHGFTADLDEDGAFVALSERAAQAGLDTLRFSFRGHGRSGGTQRGVTIAGEMLDLQAAFEHAKRLTAASRMVLLAVSFATAPAVLSLPCLEPALAGLVLWNPVLDLRRTFVDPDPPRTRRSFGENGRRHLAQHGWLDHEGFEVGRVLYKEMRTYRLYEAFAGSSVPALIVHGDADTYVSYDIAATAARERRDCELVTIAGAEHGFPGRHADVVADTLGWMGRGVLPQ